MSQSRSTVDHIRAASRQLVRELGFMSGTLAGTDLSPSAVHALIEIDASDAITARDLGVLLRLEKSSVSRMLRKLIVSGDVLEAPGDEDARTKKLSLSMAGKQRVGAIHAFARAQVASALEALPPEHHRTVLDGLRLYAGALASKPDAPIPASLSAGPASERLVRAQPPPQPRTTSRRAFAMSTASERLGGMSSVPKAKILAGYRPGLVARVTEMHALYYAREAGFGRRFETIVAGGLAAFCERLDKPVNAIFAALQDDRIIGSLAIDGEDAGTEIAHLRWFIVADEMRGAGLGRQLLETALTFSDAQRVAETHLWTFAGLQAARHLFETCGFVLAEENLGTRWGTEMLEQRFVRRRP